MPEFYTTFVQKIFSEFGEGKCPSCCPRFPPVSYAHGRPKAPPATQNASQKSSGRDTNKEVGGTKFRFGQLILRKIIEIVATRCHILRLKCTKFNFGWGSTLDPALRKLTALPQIP